eukprot:5985410-Amphidinium_carterae.1
MHLQEMLGRERLKLEEILANEGLRHPDVASTLTKLADLHGLLGDAARKRDLLANALEIQQGVPQIALP